MSELENECKNHEMGHDEGKSNSEEVATISKIENQWTDSLLEEYGKLPIPSLYDFLLMHEKLAVEIRKQNKELKGHSERISNLIRNSDSLQNQVKEFSEQLEGMQHPKEDFQEEESYSLSIEQRNSLIEMMDMAMQLLNSSEKCFDAILKIVPKKSGFLFSSKASWRQQLENIIQGFREGLGTVQEKLENVLKQEGLELINPRPGDGFDPLIHKAIETKSGKTSLQVERVVRCGYAIQDEVLRPADVIIN